MPRNTPEFVAAHLQDVRGVSPQRLALRVEAIECRRDAKRAKRGLRSRQILDAMPFSRRSAEIRPQRPVSDQP